MRSAVWTRYHRKQVAPCVEVGHTLDLGDLSATSDSTGLHGPAGPELKCGAD